MMEYKIEKRDYGSTWIYVIGENAKKEKLTIEIVHCENLGGKKSLPYLWWREGWTDKVIETWIGCSTYVHDSEGGCYGGYNVTERYNGKKNVINFDWLLEDTEENRKKIIEACIKLFESATGKSATEIKLEKIHKYAKENDLTVLDKAPNGWKQTTCLTAPYGALLYVNNEPLFIKNEDGKKVWNKNRKQVLVIGG